jgi:hypothetical protein
VRSVSPAAAPTMVSRPILVDEIPFDENFVITGSKATKLPIDDTIAIDLERDELEALGRDVRCLRCNHLGVFHGSGDCVVSRCECDDYEAV